MDFAKRQAEKSYDMKHQTNLDNIAQACYNDCLRIAQQLNTTPFCSKNTNCFFKDWKYMGPAGDRYGQCGSQKDHKRFYCCEYCYNLRNL